MPAYASHYLFAKEMMDKLCKLHGGPLCEDAVYFGTQGPDIFFFHRALPNMPGRSCRKVGSALHRAKPSLLFDSMADYVRASRQDNTAVSYAYGFLCHYALDRAVHPFVYGLQEQIVGRHPLLKGFTVHNAIEFSLDNVLLKKLLGCEEPWLFDTAATVPRNENVIERISELLHYVIPQSTGCAVTKGQISQAMRDTRRMQKTTNDQTGRKTAVLHAAEAVLSPLLGGYKISVMIRPRELETGGRYLNETHKVWRNPSEPDVKRTESFFDLYNRAKEECEALAKAFRHAVQTGEPMGHCTGDLSFLSGTCVE